MMTQPMESQGGLAEVQADSYLLRAHGRLISKSNSADTLWGGAGLRQRAERQGATLHLCDSSANFLEATALIKDF